MKTILKSVALMSGMFLAACTDPASVGGGAGGFDQGGNAAGIAGSVDDPTSVAYFEAAVGDRVLFAVDRSDLTQDAQFTLQGQAAWLNANPDYTAIIEGHADERGTTEYNVALGARRADEVRTYLISLGVDASRLRVVSFGKERPIEICSDEICYSANRRAVTVLASGLTS